jgi:uncharacterized protein (DUF2235 family)
VCSRCCRVVVPTWTRHTRDSDRDPEGVNVKRLVVCCDGTWNTPDQVDGGRPCPTNVTKLARAVADRDDAGVEQRLCYHVGVGSRPGERLRGGAFGFGLSRDVKDAYRWIVENYDPGDELFLFGFSRGAYTARSTAGLVRNVGVLRRGNTDRIDDAYRLYRDRASKPADVEAELFRRSYSHETAAFQTRIRFIGVWDTVGALGIPWSGVPLISRFNRRWSFHDTQLSRIVDGAFHALAIDERRRPFEPSVWTPNPDAEGQRVEQVWFPGVHCDVGGGYADSALADVPLLWIARRAEEFGLALREGAFTRAGGWGAPGSNLPAVEPDPLGSMHDSRKALYRLVPPHQRRLGETDPAHERVASTALRRRDALGYGPPGLLAYLGRARHQVEQVLLERRRSGPGLSEAA